VPLPGMLEKRLAEFGGNRGALARALVAEGWHPKNVERVLGAQVLADGGSTTSSPEGAERKRSNGARNAAAHAPAPRRRGDGVPILSGAAVTPSPAPAAPPRETPAPIAHRDVKPSNVLHLPLAERPRMFSGPGARHQCVHENACLGRALQADPGARVVHCPTWCKHLEAPSFEARLGLDGGRAEGNFR
jgi:hypothetical protein